MYSDRYQFPYNRITFAIKTFFWWCWHVTARYLLDSFVFRLRVGRNDFFWNIEGRSSTFCNRTKTLSEWRLWRHALPPLRADGMNVPQQLSRQSWSTSTITSNIENLQFPTLWFFVFELEVLKTCGCFHQILPPSSCALYSSILRVIAFLKRLWIFTTL